MLPVAPTATFPYRISAKIGEGGMGEVFRADDIELGRQVAIKALRPSFLASLTEPQAQDAIGRFLQEARAAAALSHPGVTIVHRVGTESGWPYIAMEWLDGQTLEQLLAERGRIGVELAARIGIQVLSALDAAHRAGIVHRDIKPGNLILTKDRRVKVTDFGVARVQGSVTSYTQAGTVVGTPWYAAPEQLAARPMDARADLYSVGAVLFEAVTGKPPFDAPDLYALLTLVQTATAPLATIAAPEIDPAFAEVIARALAKAPDERFAGAIDMARALQPFVVRGGPQEITPRADPRATIPRRPLVPTSRMPSGDALAMVAAIVQGWEHRPVGKHPTGRFFERLFERPLHTAAFSGAVAFEGVIALVLDGVLHGVFDPQSGEAGDGVLGRCGPEIEATLLPCPPDLDPRIVTLLASRLTEPQPRLAGLDAAFVDLQQLVVRLGAEGFDGVVRFSRGADQGLLFFSRGKQLLAAFAGAWIEDPVRVGWESWIGRSGATASVEDLRVVFPAATFRRQLRNIELSVVRAEETSAVRSDTRQLAAALELRPLAAETTAGLADTTLSTLLAGDPAVPAARWLLADLRFQFEQFGRTRHWRGLIDPLERVATVELHHAITVLGGGAPSFDAVTRDAKRNVLHVLDRVAEGTPEAVAAFVARAISVKDTAPEGADLSGAILLAPRFSDGALDAYLDALRAAKKTTIQTALGLFTHREGYLATRRGGFHVVLVEEVDGRRRPLVPEG